MLQDCGWARLPQPQPCPLSRMAMTATLHVPKAYSAAYQEQPPSGCTTLPLGSHLVGASAPETAKSRLCPPARFWGPLATPAMSFADSHGRRAWSPPLPGHISEGYFPHKEKPGGPDPDNAQPASPAQMQHAIKMSSNLERCRSHCT